VAVLDGPWKPLIAWALFWGPRSFGHLTRHIAGISRKTLRRELAEMQRHGLVLREAHLESNRRAEYALSPVGETLKPLLAAMYEWGLFALRAGAFSARARGGRGPASSNATVAHAGGPISPLPEL